MLLIDEELAKFQDLRDRPAAAQDCSHPRQQFLDRERLDEVIVRAELESGNPVRDRVTRGQEDDRKLVLLAQGLGQRKAAAAREQDVEDRQVGGGGEYLGRPW